MNLFSSQMSWNEPWFFVVRLRERSAWAWRFILWIVIAATISLAIILARPGDVGTGETVLLGLAAATLLLALLDVGNIQREVTINEDRVLFNSAVGRLWAGAIRLKEIQHVQLVQPEDWRGPFPAMLISANSEQIVLGVPRKVSLVAIANILHRLGVKVDLQAWEPPEADTRVHVVQEAFLARETSVFDEAPVWPVDEREGRLTPTRATVVAAMIALGPLPVAVLGLLGAGGYLLLQWGALSVLMRCLVVGGAAVSCMASALYLVLAGQFLAARYSVRVARNIMAARPSAQFSGAEEDLIPVEIFDRTAWLSPISRSVDFGFLQVDAERRILLFEGDRNRWLLPLSVLSACRLEEAHVGNEGEGNNEERYYVVIAFDREGDPWEVGIVQTRIQLGNDGKQQRYTRAKALFTKISAIASTT